MRFSNTIKSSSQSLPSPNGAQIATLLPTSPPQLTITSTSTLSLSRILTLPSDLLSSVTWFIWSPSSTRILLASQENIRVYSPSSSSKAQVHITHPGPARITHIAFGRDENGVLVWLDYGLKVSVYNLVTGKAVDVLGPKLYTAQSAGRGISYRSQTGHLAILTRSGGKDVISVHGANMDIVRSWHPVSVDAQGLCWSRDGRWLLVWESAGLGHRLFVYTADGHLFKSWDGRVGDEHAMLGAGIKLVESSGDGRFVAVGDFSERVSILSTGSFREVMGLVHPVAVHPKEGLQIWQEQIQAPNPKSTNTTHTFIPATQPIHPPTSASPSSTTTTTSSPETKSGTSLLTFDTSSTLLATRHELTPTTLYVWDITTTHSLLATIILHSPITKVSWHPSINELLLIRCEGESGLVYLWDPSSDGPKVVDFREQVPGGKILGKSVVRWLGCADGGDQGKGALFFSDAQDCVLASLLEDGEEGRVPWQGALDGGMGGERAESPLQLVPASANVERKMKRVKANGREREKVSIEDLIDDDEGEDGEGGMRFSGGSEEVEDTFQFKNFVGAGTGEGRR